LGDEAVDLLFLGKGISGAVAGGFDGGGVFLA
jgi:hypothetical protein